MKSPAILTRTRLYTAALFFIAATCPVMGQETQDESVSDNEVVELDDVEVVVTAERRDRNLQTTPVAATVLSGEDLERLGVNIVDQVQFVTPSAVVNNFGQGIDFNIRGIGKAEHNTQTTTGVITYRDGIATFPGYFTAEPYYDISSMEVLRGPQGTFGGQNATGGAVFVHSNDPVIGGDYDGYVRGQFGNFSEWGIQGAMNIPGGDTFASRVAFYSMHRDSFYDISGPYTGDDGVDINAVRYSALWEPDDKLRVRFKTDYNSLGLSAYPADPVNSPNDLFDITANADLYAKDRFLRSVLQVDYQFDNGLSLRSISGYQDGNTKYRTDLDGSIAGFNTFADSVDEVIYSQEFDLISDTGGRYDWILGLYWQFDEYDFLDDEFVIGVPPGSPASEYVLDGTNPKHTSAIFGQFTYDLSDNLELELGGRYTKARTSNDIHVEQYGVPIDQQQGASFSNFSGKVALNWSVDDSNFLYGFVASGFRPGGLNVPVGLGLPDPFDEEEVMVYELGWKALWNNRRVRTQLSAFHNDYDNFQVSIGYPDFPVFSIELNTPETTTISGVEAQVQAHFGGWFLAGGVGLISSELGTFYATDPRIVAATPCDPETGPASASCINLDGRDQTYAPDLTFNFSLQYEFLLNGGDSITPSINYAHISEQWATLFQNEALGDRIEERDIVNASISWRHDDLIFTAYANNLTDERYVGAINSGLRFAGMPRQYGLQATLTF